VVAQEQRRARSERLRDRRPLLLVDDQVRHAVISRDAVDEHHAVVGQVGELGVGRSECGCVRGMPMYDAADIGPALVDLCMEHGLEMRSLAAVGGLAAKVDRKDVLRSDLAQ
jgi:hypothetical protein